MIPDYITHYHRVDREPFLNLSDLSDDELGRIVEELEHERVHSEQKRIFAPPYMDFRKRTEEELRALFIASGGRPARAVPHYFVLGRSLWMETLYPETRCVVLPLDEVDDDVLSFTYPDSMAAMALAREWGFPLETRDYHDKVFRRHDLESLVERYGLPEDDPEKLDGEKYIEVQLWSDEAVEAGRGMTLQELAEQMR